jgi:ankyrin repeat protein
LQSVAEVVQVGSDNVKTESYSVGGAIAVIESTNPLVEAVLREDLEDVKARVMMRARINSRDKGYDGMSPLHAAVETGNLEIAKFLLERGARPNIRDFQKRTPIMMLDEDASPAMLDLLLRYGAKIQLVDKERNTVLHHFAAYDGQEDMLRLLINQGVAVNAVNKAGETALMVAVENESASNVRALLESGANADAVNREGKSALDLASNEEVRSLLASYGAVARAQ